MRASSHRRDTTPVAFAVAVGLLLAAVTAGSAHLFGPSARSVASLGLQHAAVLAGFVTLAGIAGFTVVRAALFLSLVSYVLSVEADALSMAVFSVPADAVMHILSYGDDPMGVLAQAHISPDDLSIGVAIVGGQILLLAALYGMLPRRDFDAARPWRFALPALALASVFVGEQAVAREGDDYLRRHALLPGYFRVFKASTDEYTFSMPRPAPESRVDEAVAAVHGAGNPKNVIFILLESVRYDVIDPVVAPNLSALRDEALSFDRAYADSTYTARVWNVLLLNRPAYMVFRDVEAVESGAMSAAAGAFPARVLKAAGYRIFVSMPTEFEWFGFQQRFMGTGTLVDRFFSSYPGHNHARHVADDEATDEVVRWLGEKDFQDPFFLLMQLDSTHYRYFFHEDQAVITPYAGSVSPREVTTQANLDLLFNRYKNAVHHVDHNIGRVIEALKRSNRYDDTAIVVISDHGEGFDLGAVAHMQVNEVTKRVPWIMRLPGVAAERVSALTSHSDVFPTLFEYLDVRGLDRGVLLGRPAWSPPSARRSVLTLQGSMKQAMLTFPLVTVQFEIGWPSQEQFTFLPIGILGADGKPVGEWRELLSALPWKTELEGNLRWSGVDVAARPGAARDGGA